MRTTHILVMPDYKPGDQAPTGYLQWHEWAKVQHKAGLRAKQCGRCGLWNYPQGMSSTIDKTKMQSRKGAVTVETPVCNKCNDSAAAKKGTP